MIKHINMIPVESSQIGSIGYDQETQELYVQFKKGGATYIYYEVTQEEFDFLLDDTMRSETFKRIKATKEYTKAE